MSATHYIVLPGNGAARVAAVDARGVRWAECDCDRDASPAVQAKSIEAALQKLNCRGEPILLALPSTICLAAPISLDGLSPRDRVAMAYRLEEQLPIAAEEFVCDFVPNDSAALGVAVPLASIKPLIDALQALRIEIQCLTPFAMLAATDPGSTDRLTLISDGDSISAIEVRAGCARSWSLIANNPSSVRMCASEQDAGAVAAIGIDEAVLREAGIEQAVVLSGSAEDRAALAGARILSGKDRPWIELQRDALAPRDRLASVRGSLNTLLGAAAIMFLAISAAALIRAARYSRAADAADAQLAADFRSVYPDWTPSNIPAVVESEHRKLSATTAAKLPDELRGSALRTLHDVISSVPAGGGFSVERMTFDDATFDLQGKAASLGDIDTLANAARATGMTVEPPQSRREDDGKWSFTIRGSKLQTAASVAQEGR